MWFAAAVLLSSAPLLAQRAGGGVKIEILEQHPDRLRLAYSAGSSLQPLISDGEALSAYYLGSLCKTSVTGMPLAGEVELEIVEAIPAGTFDMPRLNDEEWDLPLRGPAFLGEPGFVRNQRVVQVSFAPRAVGDGRVQLFSRIVADLYFPVNGLRGRRERARAASPEERFYQQALINYDQAISWRQARAAAKPVAQDEAASQRLRITVRQLGMHRLTGEDLAAAGVSLNEIVPDAIRLWYGGGFTLGVSRRPHQGALLREVPIVVDDDDGDFDRRDAIIFHGEPAERWVFSSRDGGVYSWQQNPYTSDNVYFLELEGEGNGRRAGNASGALSEPNAIASQSFRERIHMEEDTNTVIELLGIKSGYDWFWQTFRGNAREFSASLQDVVSEQPVAIKVMLWGFSEGRHQFDMRWNDRVIGVRSFTGSAAQSLTFMASQEILEGANKITLSHRDNAATRLDWFELEYSRHMRAHEGALSFDGLSATGLNTDEAGQTPIAQFELAGFDNGLPRIFEYRTPRTLNEIVDFEHDAVTGSTTFQSAYTGSGSPPLFLAVDDDGWKRPAAIEWKPFAGLRTRDNGAEYVIITHEEFRTAAERLAAWRAADDRFGTPLTTHVADVEDIYDEFSGGLVDPMAIRSFVNYAVDNWAPAPVFILLMGDGSYDYRNNYGTSHTNWIPPFQDGQSMYDEWYVRIDGGDVLPDLAIGRLPVGSASEADAVVAKLISYDRNPEIGPWQARVLLVADDRVNPSSRKNEWFFVRDAELIAREFVPEDLDVAKLYFGQFPLEGRTKPLARKAFIKEFNEGSLFLTYIGHGNPETIAHEQVFVLSRDLASVDNGRRLPLVYTAASQIGAFDDPLRRSIPEIFINDPHRGVIGFISATRVGVHISNVNLAKEFHELMYLGDEPQVPVGLALTVAKQRVPTVPGDRANIQRYSLLGDPAQILNRPFLRVQIEAPDSLKAFQEVAVQGQVLDASGEVFADYQGEARVQAFDSSATSRVQDWRWEQPGAPIFRALTPVVNGEFEAVMLVPKDISYGEPKGRISVYVWGEGLPTAFGSTNGIHIGGSQTEVVPDVDGPKVTLVFDGGVFQEGGMVPGGAVLTVSIEDDSGINVTGEVGHQIELQIDDELFTVTDSYNSRNGSYKTGSLEFELPALEPGRHELRLRIWDNSNNSTQLETTFQIAEPPALSSVAFHPNPVQDQGYFTYVLKGVARDVGIKVFTMSGRLVDELEGHGLAGYNQVSWEPPATLANGTYLYRIAVTGDQGLALEATSALQVLR